MREKEGTESLKSNLCEMLPFFEKQKHLLSTLYLAFVFNASKIQQELATQSENKEA